jgi:hypothetical protein
VALYSNLLAMAADPGGRPAAIHALASFLHRRVGFPVASRNGDVWRIDRRDRYDVAQDVLLKLIERPELVLRVVAHQKDVRVADVIAAAYIERMLLNRWIDIVRERKRRSGVMTPALHGSSCAPEEAKAFALWRFDPLVKALGHLCARSRARARGYELTFLDLVDLASQRASMSALIAGELARDPALGRLDAPKAARIARNRLHMQQSRLRRYLRRSIRALERAGALGRDEARDAHEALDLLVRAHRADARPHTTGDDAPPASVKRACPHAFASGSASRVNAAPARRPSTTAA